MRNHLTQVNVCCSVLDFHAAVVDRFNGMLFGVLIGDPNIWGEAFLLSGIRCGKHFELLRDFSCP